MTSAQNHRQPLNGNSFSLFLFLLTVFLFGACNTNKRTTERTRTSRPDRTERETKTARKADESMDTIMWTEIDRSRDYLNTIKDYDLDKKDVYNVHLFIPFNVKESTEAHYTDEASKLGSMLQFYAGAKLAFEQLAEEGIRLNVSVHDAESGNFNQQLKEARDADLIIGPRDRKDLISTAQFGRLNEIPVVSPWLSSSNVAEENPYYIQLIPSVRDHYARIVEHINERFPADQVFLLGRKNNKDMAMMRYIQSIASDGREQRKYNELYLNEDSLMTGVYAFKESFMEDKRTVFVLPNYSFSEDEDFVYDVVRKMSAEKGLREVVLYGMPLLLESDKISFEYYNNLNMRIARTAYVDREDPIVKEFRELYFRKYNDFPSEEAFEGFDIVLYLGRNLFDYGKQFQYFLDSYRASLVHTVFDVQKVFKEADDRFSKIEYLQNKHLYILSFEDYKFQKQ